MSIVGLDSVIRIDEEALHRTIDGETVVLSLRTGCYHGLDEIGSVIWELLAEGRDLRSILDHIVGAYEVDEEVARADLLELLEALRSEGLIRIGAV